MSLAQKIETDLNDAVKTANNFQRDTLRLIRSELKNAEIKLGRKLENSEIIDVLNKEAKKRRESIQAYKNAGKADLAESELKELELIEAYLPEYLSEKELRSIVNNYLKNNPVSAKEAGRAIGELAKQLKGKADIAAVARLVHKELGSL